MNFSLTSENFAIVGTKLPRTLLLKYNKRCFVIFKSSRNASSLQVEKMLINIVSSVKEIVGSLDIDAYYDLPRMSKGTTTEITSVPTIIFYMNGNPLSRFKGEFSMDSLKSFVIKSISKSNELTNIPPSTPSLPNPNYSYPQPAHLPPPSSPSPQNYSQSQQKPFYGANNPSLGNSSNEEDTLLLPNSVIPHNTPWEAEFRSLETT